MTTCGVDTLSLAWRPRSEDPFDGLRELGFNYGPAGSYVAAKRGPADERVIAWPTHGVVAVEGRMAAMLDRCADNHELARPTDLASAEKAAAGVLGDLLGYRPKAREVCEVRRYDLAFEHRFERGAEGLAFLRALGSLCPPRCRVTQERSADGQLMTVYVRTAKRGVVQNRWYDKGLEAGTDLAGERVRLEAQNRPAKADRYEPATLARLDLSTHFARKMVTYMRATEDVVVAGSTATVDELFGRVARGELTMAKAERLAGSLAALRLYGRSIYSERQGQRRLADLRTAGVLLDDELPADATVPVGALLREAVESFA